MVLNKENNPLLLAFFLSSKLKQDLFLLKPKNKKEEQDFLHPGPLCPLGTGVREPCGFTERACSGKCAVIYPFPFTAEDLLGVGALSHLAPSYHRVSARGCASSGVSVAAGMQVLINYVINC